MSPQRIQRRRTKGWRMPENTVYVGRGTRWGSPFKIGSTPLVVGIPKYSLSLDGASHRYVTTAQLSVDLYRAWVAGEITTSPWHGKPPSITEIRRELSGRNLMCWCPSGAPCHADLLLELANGETK